MKHNARTLRVAMSKTLYIGSIDMFFGCYTPCEVLELYGAGAVLLHSDRYHAEQRMRIGASKPFTVWFKAKAALADAILAILNTDN